MSTMIRSSEGSVNQRGQWKEFIGGFGNTWTIWCACLARLCEGRNRNLQGGEKKIASYMSQDMSLVLIPSCSRQNIFASKDSFTVNMAECLGSLGLFEEKARAQFYMTHLIRVWWLAEELTIVVVYTITHHNPIHKPMSFCEKSRSSANVFCKTSWGLDKWRVYTEYSYAWWKASRTNLLNDNRISWSVPSEAWKLICVWDCGGGDQVLSCTWPSFVGIYLFKTKRGKINVRADWVERNTIVLYR